MKATKTLHDLGQSLWLDNITRDLLNSGTLQRYIDEFSVTGLTSNPTIFDHAIKNSTAYDADDPPKGCRRQVGRGAVLRAGAGGPPGAADLFRPIHERTDGVDGWVSLEVSPLLAHDTRPHAGRGARLHQRAASANLFIKIPGTKEGLPAIEEAIFAGIPINVTLLFSREQYLAAAEAYLRGIERRIEAGSNPTVASVASLFVSRWDVAVAAKSRASSATGSASPSRNAPTRPIASCSPRPRLQRAANAGARPQRLLWASTGTKDPEGLRRPVCESARRAVHRQHHAGQARSMPSPITAMSAPRCAADGGDCEPCWPSFAKAGIDVEALATRLQEEGAAHSSNPGTN